jgi:hypothetical protein
MEWSFRRAGVAPAGRHQGRGKLAGGRLDYPVSTAGSVLFSAIQALNSV